MEGWKTWLAVIGMIIYAIVVEGIFKNDWNSAMLLILQALALIGIGHKLDKAKK